MYTPKFIPAAVVNVREMPKADRKQLKEKLETVISADPIGCSEALTGPLAEFRSYHFGDYRVIYRVFESCQLFVVVGVGKKDADHHAEIYKHLEALANAGKLAGSVLENLRMLNPPS